MGRTSQRWVVDLDDPRAPPMDIWREMSEEERAEVVATLPSEFPLNEAAPPEGDFHSEPQQKTRDTLKGYFSRSGRGAYVGADLPVYYPDVPMFAPDILVVLDVVPGPRDTWVVAAEGKGLDLALEILVAGRRAKDLRDNVHKYARLGIPEYFVYEPRTARLHGWTLEDARGAYRPIVPQHGTYRSEVLGLDLAVIDHELRLLSNDAVLPNTWELNVRLSRMLSQASERAEAEAQRAEAEAQRAQTEAQRADDAERRLAEALARLRELEDSKR